MDKATLREVQDAIRWQWHRETPDCESSYIAGFQDKRRALQYGERHGWIAGEVPRPSKGMD